MSPIRTLRSHAHVSITGTCKAHLVLFRLNIEKKHVSFFYRTNQRPLEEPFEMEPNVLYFVRYKPIKKLVEEGKIDLY